MPAYNPTVAKLVSSPTQTAWAQAYNAGNLFAVLSLAGEKESDESDLKSLGKDVFSNLQAEFFTLEEKTLQTITEAIETAIKELPKEIILSFCVAYQRDDILYVFIAGTGQILLKRDGKFGTLLLAKEHGRTVHKASGKLAHDDICILQTAQSTSIISVDTLRKELEENVEDAAEAFMPQLHGQEDGGAAALFVKFQKDTTTHKTDDISYAFSQSEDDEPLNEKAPEEAQDETPPKHVFDAPQPHHPPVVPLEVKQEKTTHSSVLTPVLNFASTLSHRFGKKRLVLGMVAIVLACILLLSITRTIQQNQTNTSRTKFTSAYSQAKQQYEEGQDLVGLNDTLAKEDFTKAKDTLEKAKQFVTPDTPEEEQYNDLLSKIDSALGTGAIGQETTLTATDAKDSPLLQEVLKKKDILYATSFEDTLYTLSPKEIADTEKTLVVNDNDWTTPGGFAAYNGNLYVLDKKAGILKFVAGSDGYGKSNYFTEAKPDLSQAVAMAIDSSVYVLYKDGSVLKFTKGVADTFTISGLVKPATDPKALVTNADMENLYILDSGSGRVIVLGKDGNFKNQYQSNDLKGARMLDVSEKREKSVHS